VYLGDPYSATVLTAASIGATVLNLDDTSEFLASGGAVVGTQAISYTGISGLTLTGVTGVTIAITANSTIVPNKEWKSGGQVSVMPIGSDISVLSVSLQYGGGGWTFPGMPLVMSWSSLLLSKLSTGQSMAIGIKLYVPSGSQEEFTSWGLLVSPMYPKVAGFGGSITTADIGDSASMCGYVNRHDQMLPQYVRLLPSSRDVSSAPAGFTIGKYCWRDDTEINAQSIVPTNWNIDPSILGNEKFIPGIGCGDDLEPLGFVQQNNSIYLQINRGFYYTGVKGYYLPGTPQLDILNALGTQLPLSKTPQPILPIFVGTYSLDSQGFYEKAIEYRYETAMAVTRGIGLPEYYYTLNRSANTITLNAPLPLLASYLGVISGNATDYFNLPIYPVDNVSSVYVQRSDGTHVVGVNWTLNKADGTIAVTNPSGTGPSIASTFTGEMVVADCVPALAVLYDTGETESLVLSGLDLNPAFAGISSGYVYLQQSRQNVGSLVLSCDKPIINVPATYVSIIDLVAYGPVYFNGDYALLQVTAYSKVSGEVVQGAELEVNISDPDFLGTPWAGTLNGIDPTVETVTVTTGADGSANLVYRPEKDYGFYIPPVTASGGLAGLATTIVTNDTVVLPEPVAISQVRPIAEGTWQVTLYTIYNNNPVFGMVGAGIGQVPWVATVSPNGPGTVGYKTNGEIEPIVVGTNILYPSQAQDAAGRNYDDVLFDGNVVRLVYPQTLSTGATVGAYFVTLVQRVLLRMQAVGSNVESNSILIQMGMQPVIYDNIWLILDDAINGILDQYRLGLSGSTSGIVTSPPPPGGGFGVGGFGESPFGT